MSTEPVSVQAGELDVVVLVRSADAGWVRALTAQVAGLPVHLAVREHPAAEIEATADRLVHARPSTMASTTIWLVPEGDVVALFVYDGARGRLYCRTSKRAGSAFATQEVLAVIARRALESLTQGELEGLDLVEAAPVPTTAPTPTPAPAPNLPPRTIGAFHVALGYRGESFAPQSRWESGAQLSVGWAFALGASLDLQYTLLPRQTFENSAVRLTLRRYPIALAAGYRRTWPRVVVHAQLTANLDVIVPSTRVRATDGLETAPRYVLEPGVGAQVRGVVFPTAWLGFFISGGAGVYPNTAPWASRVGTEQILVAPRRVRPAASMGLEFRLRVRATNLRPD